MWLPLAIALGIILVPLVLAGISLLFYFIRLILIAFLFLCGLPFRIAERNKVKLKRVIKISSKLIKLLFQTINYLVTTWGGLIIVLIITIIVATIIAILTTV